MNKPRCKKCNRPLRDPISVAIGVGPECRGDAGGGKSVHVKVRKSHKAPYVGVGQSAQVGGVLVAHTPDGWTINGKGGPLVEAWLRQYMPGVMVEDASYSSATIVRGQQSVMEFSQ